MTVIREQQVGRPENGAQGDRAAVLSSLSKELTERLGKHPLPQRTILPLARPRWRWHWLVRPGFVAAIGACTAAVALTHLGVPWKPLEMKSDSTKGTEEEVASLPFSPIATATAQSGPVAIEVPDLAPSRPPEEQASQQLRDQAIAPPEVPAASATPAVDRELTWTEVHELQARLRTLQFDPGPLDGVKGPLTSAAVRRFEESRGQRATGDATLSILIQLRAASSRTD